MAIVTDDPRYGLHQLSITVGDEPLRIPLVAAWDPTHYAADTIDAWAGALEAFTHERYGLTA